MSVTARRPDAGPVLAIGDVAAGIALVGDVTGTVVAVLGGLMALMTFGALPAAWRGAGWALRTVAGTRLLGALTAVRAFFVDDVAAEVERLRALGVVFTQEAVQMGPVTTAVLDDTCGNLIQLVAQG